MNAQRSQFSINAAIAEKLGFTVDPDTWRRRLKADGGDELAADEVEVRKCAFWIPDYVRRIIGRDGSLVDQGREAQRDYYALHGEFERFLRMINGQDDETDVGQVEQSDVADAVAVMRHGACIMEFAVPVGGGTRRYVAGIKPRHGGTWFAVADRSFVKHGLDIDVIERHDSPDGTKQHAYREYFDIAARVLGCAPDMLTAARRAEWDRL